MNNSGFIAVRIFAFLVAACSATGANAQTSVQPADVAVVAQVQGDVGYVSASREQGRISPYMRVRDGDRLTLGAGAELRIVFFDTGRAERWVGPASLRAAKGGAQALTGKPVEVGKMPTSAPVRIARVPALLQNAKLGGIQVRGGPPKGSGSAERDKSVREARAAYDEMRLGATATDITPELFLYSALSEYALYDQMEPVVKEMLRRQPDSEEANSFAGWLKTRTGH